MPPRHDPVHGDALSCDRGLPLPEITPFTNRIGRHSARIKAAGHDPYQLWLLRKFDADSSRTRSASGHVRAVGRGHHATDHAAAGFGRNAGAAGLLALD